jgi:hypothetical protein
MATTPDPIEGWRFTCERRTDKYADGLKWTAHGGAYNANVWLEGERLRVEDNGGPYDAAGTYLVPLAVIDALRRLAAEEAAAKPAGLSCLHCGGVLAELTADQLERVSGIDAQARERSDSLRQQRFACLNPNCVVGVIVPP